MLYSKKDLKRLTCFFLFAYKPANFWCTFSDEVGHSQGGMTVDWCTFSDVVT
jgi:hypothetical protein